MIHEHLPSVQNSPPPTTYVVRVPPVDGWEVRTLGDLLESVFASAPAAEPESWHQTRGEWYCTGARCDVREVVVREKHFRRRPPRKPGAKVCPSCRQPLKFHHWLKSVELVPVEGGE